MKRRDFIKKLAAASASAAIVGCGVKEDKSTPQIVGRKDLIKLNGITSIHEHVDSVEGGEILIKAMDRTGLSRVNLLGSYTTLLQGKEQDWGSGPENNEILLKLIRNHPERFSMFALIDGAEDDVLGVLRKYLDQGALGVKMYNGVAGKYRRMPINDKRLKPLYEFCEKNAVPILIHVDAQRHGEFFGVVREYPSIPWICPHLFVMTKPSQIERLEQIFREYPNVCTDQSFGFEGWMDSSLRRLSKSRERVRNIFIKNSDRILFGTDIVVAIDSKHRTVEWASNSISEYRKFLEYDSFEHDVQSKNKRYQGFINGLALPESVLQRIYVENAKRFLMNRRLG